MEETDLQALTLEIAALRREVQEMRDGVMAVVTAAAPLIESISNHPAMRMFSVRM